MSVVNAINCYKPKLLQLSRREITIQQLEHELSQVKAQYREAVEENGRLEARIQAFAINAQSEQDVLNSEVCKITLKLGLTKKSVCFR